MNVLFSLNEVYVSPLKVLLHSIFYHHPKHTFDIYVMHASMGDSVLEDLRQFIEKNGHNFFPLHCKDFFPSADEVVITRYYTLEMYLWMFAPYILPDDVDRVLYLDPDIINANDFSALYTKNFQGHLFVATNYKYKTKWVQPFNNLRLRNFDSENFFNSGVVLMNVKELRKVGNPNAIIEAIRANKPFLILPDQDIFNVLYDEFILEEDWRVYNMNPKVYDTLNMLFPYKYNKEWVEDKVVFIHYCGKHKPWKEREKYKYTLGTYYFKAEEQISPIIEKKNEK